MVVTTLFISGIFGLAAGGVYAYVGREAARRRVEGDARVAIKLFATWWRALAAVTIASGLLQIFGSFQRPGLAYVEMHTLVVLLGICIALWALMYYFTFLFTGSTKSFSPLAAFYGLLYAAMVYFVVAGDPVDVKLTAWRVELVYGQPTSQVFTLALVVALLLPPIIGAIGYASLAFRLQDRGQRYRIGLISGSIGVWFLSSVVASILELDMLGWWPLASRAIGLFAAFLVLSAFRPPPWVQRRFELRSFSDESA